MQFSDNRTLCAVQGSTITEGVYICIDKLYTQTTNLAEVCIIYIRQNRLQLMHLAQLIPKYTYTYNTCSNTLHSTAQNAFLPRSYNLCELVLI